MRIQVVAVSQEADGHLSVTFESGAGRARGKWVSKNCNPEVGKAYDAEMDAEAIADRQTNTSDGRQGCRGLRIENGVVVLEADIAAIDDDGLAYLRLADDCLLMIETSGDFSTGEVLRIELPFPAVSVTVTGAV
jgi:hypothetical protein